MRKLIAALVVLGALAVAGIAGAAVNHALGSDGKVYVFDEQCHRVSFIPPGISVREGLNVVAQQARCLVRRPDPFQRCVHKLGPAPTVVGKFDHGDGKPGDWTNVDKVAAYEAGIYACSSAHFNNAG